MDAETEAVNIKPPNPPAFPRTGYFPDTTELAGDALREVLPSITEPQPGMTLRDYFAAKAMTALIDGYDYEAREKSQKRSERTGFDDHPHADSDSTYASQLAEEAYIIADAMLKARAI